MMTCSNEKSFSILKNVNNEKLVDVFDAFLTASRKSYDVQSRCERRTERLRNVLNYGNCELKKSAMQEYICKYESKIDGSWTFGVFPVVNSKAKYSSENFWDSQIAMMVRFIYIYEAIHMDRNDVVKNEVKKKLCDGVNFTEEDVDIIYGNGRNSD